MNPPRKVARAASPLKGAAGRRLDQQRRAQQGQGTSASTHTPMPIPRDITFLLGLIPPAYAYNAQRFSPDGMVRLLHGTTIPDFNEWKSTQNQASRTESAPSRAHTRNASTEYPTYTYPRDSPGPSARPLSPYGGARPPPASVPYRNSPLRPGSSGSYEPPPASYQGLGQAQFTPVSGSYPAWQAGGFPPPNTYAQPPNQQPYGGWS
jgi:cleavage stimulation factor subunit 3